MKYLMKSDIVQNWKNLRLVLAELLETGEGLFALLADLLYPKGERGIVPEGAGNTLAGRLYLSYSCRTFI